MPPRPGDRHVDVVAEGLKAEIRLLAEGYQASHDLLDKLPYGLPHSARRRGDLELGSPTHPLPAESSAAGGR